MRVMVAVSNRSLLYSSAPVRPCSVSSRKSVKSNFAVTDLQLQGCQLETWQCQFPPRGALQNKHHLDQRRMAQVPLRLQRLDHGFKGNVLVVIGVQGGLPHPFKQFEEGWITGQIGPEYQGVDKKADQRLQFLAVAIGDRGTDQNIFLTAVACEQRCEDRQNGHEQRGV